MGEVWTAVLNGAAGFEKTIAVKRVLAHLEEDPEFLARFFDEARIAASLTHGNIVSVFDLGVDDEGTFFLAMEWIDGWDLRKVVRILAASGDTVPPDVAARIAADLCNALGYAHTRRDAADRPLRIVHRDVSPSNVLLSRAGGVKLTDFGIASARERTGRTATGQLRGKFAYMSPEQASGKPVDPRSDLFAVGALLFEMLSGKKAFDGDSDLDTLDRVRTGNRQSVAAACAQTTPEVPAALLEICEKALSVDPAARFQSAEAMEDALRALIATEWGALGASRVRTWARERLGSDPLLRAQERPGGANLDDLLNAQLDLGPEVATPSNTDSKSIPLINAAWSGMGAPAASGIGPASASGRQHLTVTQSTLPPPPRRRSRAPIAVAVSLLVLLGLLGAGVAYQQRSAPTLVVESDPPGAQVYVDGVPSGVTALHLRLPTGTHEISVRLPGYAHETASVSLERGRSEALEFELRAGDRPVAFHSFPAGALVTVGDTQVPAGNSVSVPVGVPVMIEMELEGHAPLREEVVFDSTSSVLTRRLVPLEAVAAGSGAGSDAAGSETAGAVPDAEGSALAAANSAGREPSGSRTEQRPDSPRTPPDSAPDTTRVAAPDTTRVAAGSTGGTEAEGLPGHITLRFVEAPMVGRISIDGHDRGTNHDLRAVFELPPGEHQVEVENTAAGVRYSRTVRIESGATETLSVDWQ